MFAGERLREAGVIGLNIPLMKEIPLLWKALPDEEKKVCTCMYMYMFARVLLPIK